MSSLGIDIGGANLKVASKDGWEIIYFPMWREAERLEGKLREIAEKYSASKAGVVMTAELADFFKSRAEGVEFIAKACKKAFEDVRFLDVEGNLKSDIDNPENFAASNWVASCRFLLEEAYRNFLFVDMGSTTTDIIPVTSKIDAAKTDFERLKRGELIYFGVLRTPVFYVLKEFEGAPLCPEFFAITADVFVTTGDIKEEDYSCDTPDGKGRSKEECMRRLARTVCSDLEELGEEKVKELALEAKWAMIDRLSEVIEHKSKIYGLKTVFACGIGEFLIAEACEEAGVECRLISELYGEYSKLFPAYAMLKLVEQH
ncbi:hydantoinase/oxoprolinase family protein [Archaeoglobus sp.]|uniref:hydantoinase/oxoprolinase family protein n=1 Tax=Archaeoglobus sp. TaxID=1872626 RepID=UPI0024AB61FF|nr:hydantoinase/oxoprolinase family protein [Archaeoglobus sp.]MDI3497286.1 (((gamma-L-glutamylamino)ethyl phenoxymethyl)furan-2-yl)methanamine synthase [Archaeoglobus sp.]